MIPPQEWDNIITAATAGLAIILGTILTGWQARTSTKLKDLEARMTLVEAERDALKHLLRVAIRHIREWIDWSRNHPEGQPKPEVPEELRDEV